MKRRTIPQVELRALSGECTPLFVDSYTLQVLRQLWTVTQYRATFLLNGKEKDELQTDFEIATHNALTDAVIEDFERGYLMACDFAGKLDGIINAIAGLKLQPTACCGGGSGGSGGSGGNPDDAIVPPEDGYTEGQRSTICRAINYARDLTTSYLDLYIEPVLGMSLESIAAAMIASWVTPPYSTTVLETAGFIVAALTVMSASALSPLLSDVIDAVFDGIYCKVFGEDGYTSGIAGWVQEKATEIAGEYAYIIYKIILWVIGASGAMDVLTNWANALVPASYSDVCPTCYYSDEYVEYTQYNPCMFWDSHETICDSIVARHWSDSCIPQENVTPEIIDLTVPNGNYTSLTIYYMAISYYMVGGIEYELYVNNALVDSWGSNQKNCDRQRTYTGSVTITSARLKVTPRRDQWDSWYKIKSIVWS